LKYLITGLVIFFAENTFPADGLIFALIAYLSRVNEHRDVSHDKFHGLSHRFIQRPRNPSQRP